MPENVKYSKSRVAEISAFLSQKKGLLKVAIAIAFLALLQGSISLLAATVPPPTSSVTLGWQAANGPVAGYQIWYGTASGNYSTNIYVGNSTMGTVNGLSPGVTYYFVVTDYDATGNGSIASSEVSFTPGNLLAQLASLANGAATLTLTGLGGHAYEIQATEDFITWSVIGTITMGSTGSGSFIDPNASQHSRRFYRTHAL